MKKHLQKYLFEEKVCNLVTEISSKETGGIPEPNTNVILKNPSIPVLTISSVFFHLLSAPHS